jgi:hypothetical protein
MSLFGEKAEIGKDRSKENRDWTRLWNTPTIQSKKWTRM